MCMHMCVSGEGAERENPKQALIVTAEPDAGLELSSHEIMT